MKCNQCGYENSENATFCGNCGTRVDGKLPCRVCGRLNDEKNLYCNSCGARLDGKTVCSSCGTAYEGNFCSTCGQGRASKIVEPPSSMEGKPKKAVNKTKLTKILEIIGGASLMFGVLISLIFVFFIGVGVEGLGQLVGVVVNGLEIQGSDRGIFYFFGRYFDEVEQLNVAGMPTTAWFIDQIQKVLNIYGVFGIVITVSILVFVITFATIAICKYIKSWVYRTPNKSNGAAIACIVSFLTGTALFNAYVDADVEMYASSVKVGIDTVLNGATSTAIVLTIVALCVGVLALIIVKWDKTKLLPFLFSAIAVVISAALIGVVKNTMLALAFKEIGGTSSIDVNGGFLLSVSELFLSFGGEFSGENLPDYYSRLTDYLADIIPLSLVAQIAAGFLVVFVGLALAKVLRSCINRKGNALIWSICALVASIVVLVFQILIISKGQGMLAVAGIEDTMLANNLANPIVCIVLSVLLLVVSIVQSALNACEKRTSPSSF